MRGAGLRRLSMLLIPLVLAARATAPARGQEELPEVAPEAPLAYELVYEARLVPSERAAHVSIRLGEGAWMVKRIRFRIDPERHRDFRGDGTLEREDGAVVWIPPAKGGVLRYDFFIDHLRNTSSYDSRCAENWALFRGDDMVPPARVLSETGARARARLRLRLPDGWSAVVPYRKRTDGSYEVDHEDRRFDRPTGWFVLGKLGVLRERIAGASVAVAGPVRQGVKRNDLLALLRWTLPELRDVVGELPGRLLIVSAGDPMWRGGLSGPDSVFVHADLPLISSDVTSPVLHEMVHSVLNIQPGPGGDWIVEGLAELYSLELLVRSKTISRRRYRRALERLAEEGAEVPVLDLERSAGVVTARAVSVLRALDDELERGSDGAVGLDEVVARLAARGGHVTTTGFRELAEEVAGRSLRSFFRTRVPVQRRP